VGLCDYNPFGVALLMTYRFATVSSAFEGIGHETPTLRWLGLRRVHVLKLKSAVDTNNNDNSVLSAATSLSASEVKQYTPCRDYELSSHSLSPPPPTTTARTNEIGTLKRKHMDTQRDTYTSNAVHPFQTDALMQSMTMVDHRKIRSMLASEMFMTELPQAYSDELVHMQNGMLIYLYLSLYSCIYFNLLYLIVILLIDLFVS